MTTPLVPFGRLDRWGLHYHGSIQNDVLTLPNSSTIPFPLPSGLFQTVDLVKFDGIPPVGPMNGEQIAEGKEYRNYGLITNGQIGGEYVPGRWLHRDENGRVWSVYKETLSGVGGSISVRFTLTRFGYVVGAGVDRTHTPIVINKTVTTLLGTSAFPYYFNIVNLAPNGKKALFRAGTFEGQTEYFEASIANLNISIVKVKSITDVIDWSEVTDNVTDFYGSFWSFNPTDYTVNASGWSQPCPTSAGGTRASSVSTNVPYVQGTTIDGTNGSYWRVLTYIIRGMYDKNNDLNWVSRKVTVQHGGQWTETHTAAGGTFISADQDWQAIAVNNAYCTGGFSWGQTAETNNGSKPFYQYARLDQVHELTIELMFNGTVIQTLFSEYNQWNWSGVTTTVHMHSFTHLTEAGDGAPTTVGEALPNPDLSSDNGVNWSTFDLSVISQSEMLAVMNSIYSRLGSYYDAAVANGGTPTGIEIGLLLNMNYDFEVGDLFLSNNIHLMTFGKHAESNQQGAGASQVIKSPLITPEGVDGSQSVGVRDNTFAAFQPETEELIRDQTEKLNFI